MMAGARGEELVGFQVRLEAFGEVDGPDEILAHRNVVPADPTVHGFPRDVHCSGQIGLRKAVTVKEALKRCLLYMAITIAV